MSHRPASNCRTDPRNRPDGEYQPDTIVVLTDGRNTQGVGPVTAAEEAAARRLRVFTIGFGTTNPAPLVCTRDQVSGDAARRGDRGGGGFSGGGGGGGRNLQIDEAALTQVADMTGGEYFRAEDSEALVGVLLDLPDSIVLQRQDVEITVWFALAGAMLVLVAIGLVPMVEPIGRSAQPRRTLRHRRRSLATLATARSSCALV